MTTIDARTNLRPFSFRILDDIRNLSAIYFEAGEGVQIMCKVATEISSDPLISSRRNAKAKVAITGGDANQALINRLENVLSNLIPTDTLEKMQVHVRFEVLRCDGSLLDYLTNVGQYAMLRANLLLRDTITSATCIVTASGQYILDPTLADLKNSVGHIRLVHSAQRDKVADFEIVGLIREGEQLREAISLTVAAAKTVSKKMLDDLIAEERKP